MQAVGQSAGPSFPAGPGTIYGSLQRMEEDGLVREMPSRGDDRRRLFVLQPDGRRALETESRRILRLAQLVRAKRLVSGSMTGAHRHRASCRTYRVLLHAYPPAFRRRFGADMASDFAAILEARGARCAWRLAACDLMRSVVRSHLDAHRRARQSLFTHKKKGR